MATFVTVPFEGVKQVVAGIEVSDRFPEYVITIFVSAASSTVAVEIVSSAAGVKTNSLRVKIPILDLTINSPLAIANCGSNH